MEPRVLKRVSIAGVLFVCGLLAGVLLSLTIGIPDSGAQGQQVATTREVESSQVQQSATATRDVQTSQRQQATAATRETDGSQPVTTATTEAEPGAATQTSPTVATPAEKPDPNGPLPVSDGRLAGERDVAPGGQVRVVAKNVKLPAQVQERVGSTWKNRGRPITQRSTTFAASTTPGKLRIRAVGADLTGTKAINIRVRLIRFSAVGDINLSPAPVGSIQNGAYSQPWTSVGQRLKAADLTFGNLECAISTRGTPFSKTFTFRGAPGALKAMKDAAGFDVLNLANNHSGDFGRTAFKDTLRAVRRNGMKTVGAGLNESSALKPVVVKKLGIKIAFVGFENILPTEFSAGPNRPGVAWATADRVRSAVSAASRQADLVIATFHWGIELDTTANAAERQLANVAVGAGADLIIGGHPHVLQEIERKDKKLLAYSLGNFVFPANSAGTTKTGVLEVSLDAEGVRSSRLVPARISGATPQF